jgi:glutathione S-transferase
MRLYGFPMSPNVRRVQIVLEEVGAPHEFIPVDLAAGAQKAPEYLLLNPNGRVPTLEDDGLVIWESHAISLYLAAKYPQARLDGETPAERGSIAKWLFLNAAHFGPAFAGVFAHSFRLPEDQRIPKIAENGRAEATKILGVLDGALKDRATLATDRFTLADISFAPSLFFAPMLGFDLAQHPHVAAWFERLKERPSVRKVMMT